MKQTLFFTIADEKNLGYAKNLEKSFRYFHPDKDFLIISGETLQSYLKDDGAFFYRATPILGEKFLNDYELVVKVDADSIVLGDLSYIWDTKDYDVGTVLNWNRVDPATYGIVQGWGILPVEYMNCGLVAMRSRKFVKHWKNLCFTPQFDRLQYKEQDLLNILLYYGNYNVRCFDHGDGLAKMSAWWGLISKGELRRTELHGDKIIVPKGFGDTPFPPADMEIKIIHAAGGNQPNKMNYHTWVPEDVGRRIDEILK